MKSTLTCVVLALALSITAISANAQPPGQTLSELRIMEAADQLELFRDTVEQVGGDSTQRILDSIASSRDDGTRLRFEGFLEDVYAFVGEIEELLPLRDVPLSEPGTAEEIERLSKELDETSDRLREFVNYGTDPPQIIVAPLPDEGVSDRIVRLVVLSRRLIPNIVFLAGGDAVNLNLLNQVRDDLAIAEALSLALPESAF